MKNRNSPFGGGTPTRSGTPTRAGTPVRPSTAHHPRPVFSADLPATVAQGLAILQGLFFLLPVSSPSSRLLGIALALSTLLASRILRDAPAKRTVVLVALAVLVGVNFAFHLIASAPNFAFRMWQVAIVVVVVAYLLAMVSSWTGLVTFKRAWYVLGATAALLLLAEGALGGPEDFGPAKGGVEWVGTSAPDSTLGARFANNTVAKTFYPDNPRGYFDEPDALQRSWELLAQQGSKANLEFPAEKRGVLRVSIIENPGRTGWHISLRQTPIRILADERYELRFRARSDSVRTLYVAVSQAHPPGRNLGLSREIRVDTTWRDFSQTFRATASDRVAQIYFEFGADQSSVELSGINMRAISTGKAVQVVARRELSVSYRLNSHGCRGPEHDDQPNPGVWRILSLGDGTALGVGVHEGDTYSARLESLLNESATSGGMARSEVINCGVRGTTAHQARLLFDAIGIRYAPNLVLLSVSPEPDQTIPVVDQQQAGVMSNAGRLFRIWNLVGTARPKPSVPDLSGLIEEVRRLDAETRAKGARLVVLRFQHLRSPAWSSLDSAFKVATNQTNVPILDLGPVLLAFGEKDLLVHPALDPHPNELAHRVAAEAIRKFLSDNGLLGDAQRGATGSVDTVTARD